MRRKGIAVSLAMVSGIVGTAVAWKFFHADSSVNSSTARENPIQSAPPVITTSPEAAPPAQGADDQPMLANEDENSTSCSTNEMNPVVVSEDQIFRVNIVEGDEPEWTLPFDLQDGQTIDLTRMGRNSDIQIASCLTKGRQVHCNAVFIGNDGSGPVIACPEVKLADTSIKRIKLIARVRAREVPLPANLEQAAIKSSSPVLGWIFSAVSIEQANAPGKFQELIQFWSSAGADARLLGQVPAGFYFPPEELTTSSIPYYEQSGDRYLTDAFTQEGRIWISGVSGTPIEKMLDSVPPAFCIVEYKFCRQPDHKSCPDITRDPDDPEKDPEEYFENVRFDKVLRTANETWISIASNRTKTSLPTLYVTASDFLSMKTTYCD